MTLAPERSVSSPKRVIFLNRVYPPMSGATGQLLQDLATALVGGGREVVVVTAGPPSITTEQGVRVHRISEPAAGNSDRSLFGKWRAHQRYSRAAHHWLKTHVIAQDIVVAMTDPPALAGRLASWSPPDGVRVIHWVQDIHPEIFFALLNGKRLKPIVNFLARSRDRAWKNADGVVTLGSDMAAVIAARGVPAVKLHLAPNWAPRWLQRPTPADIRSFRTSRGWNGKFVVMYSGNLGRVHDLDSVIDLATQLRDHHDYAWVIVGDGARGPALRREVENRDLKQVTFLSRQSPEEVSLMLAAADLHVVTLREGCAGLVWPSKFYGITAMARPVLYLGPAEAEISQLIRRHHLGMACTPESLAEALLWLDELKENKALQSDLAQRVAEYETEFHGFDRTLAWWRHFLS